MVGQLPGDITTSVHDYHAPDNTNNQTFFKEFQMSLNLELDKFVSHIITRTGGFGGLTDSVADPTHCTGFKLWSTVTYLP